MNMVRRPSPWNDLASFRGAFDRLFDEGAFRPLAWSGYERHMPLDVSSTEDAITIDAALPGVRSEDIEILRLNIFGECHDLQAAELLHESIDPEAVVDDIVARYERHMVTHVGHPGDLAELEGEQTSWVPGQGPSPNRVDAMVHAGTDLLRNLEPAAIADPNKLLRRRVTGRHLRAV